MKPQLLLFNDDERSIFRHPDAQREIQLGEQRVGYALKRGRRRSIGFVVGLEGLAVAAPRTIAIAAIEAALRDKGAWILRKLGEQQQRNQALAAARVDWRDGVQIPFLGQPLVVMLGAKVAAGGQLDAATAPPRLLLNVPAGAAPAQIKDAVQSWLQRQARRIFEERCAVYAGSLGVRVRRLALSNARTRWGSASADGSVRLNWRLVHLALPLVDYVVAHELAHLRHMDHSPQFWAVVRSVYPELESARAALRDGVLPVLD